MGRPNQGNKAQTPVGYSHGTGSLLAGQLRQSRGFTLRLLWGLGEYVGVLVPAPRVLARWQLGRPGGAWDHGRIRGDVGCMGCYQREATGAAEEALGPPLGPGGQSLGVRGCPQALGPTKGGIGAAHGPRGQYSGSTGGHMEVLGCPSDPWNNSEGVLGHNLPLKQTRRMVPAGVYIA